MSRNLSVVEAKTHLSDCIREVEQGGRSSSPGMEKL